MRQVNRDELTYITFTALREWPRTRIKKLFDPPRLCRSGDIDVARKLACDVITDRLLQYMEVYDTSQGVRLLDRGGVTDALVPAFDRLPGAIGKLWLSPETRRWDDARRAAANFFTDQLAPLELLAGTPLDWGYDGIDKVMFAEIVTPPHALLPSWP